MSDDKKPKGLYLEEIASKLACGCGEPDCKNVAEWLHQRCHPREGLDARFIDGVMALYCHVCKEHVVNIMVASIAIGGG